jgi:thiol-disulfide isomerase/thioredoxin
MRMLCLKHTPWKVLLILVTAACPALAEDVGGGDSGPSIEWKKSYRQVVDEAERDGKLILVGVTASWCGPCRQLKQLTFKDARVAEIVNSAFVALSIDADEHPDLVSGFRVESYPTVVVMSPDRTIHKRMAGFQSAETMAATLSSLAKSQTPSRDTTAFDEVVSALEPANGIKFSFGGFCLVTLLEETRARKGSSDFIAEHRGQVICFQSEEHRQRFLQDPDKFWPVADGQCLVSSRDGSGSMAGMGDPRMAVTWRGRIWMFADRDHQRRFIQAPFYYSGKAII